MNVLSLIVDEVIHAALNLFFSINLSSFLHIINAVLKSFVSFLALIRIP